MTSEHSAFTFVHEAVRKQGTLHPNRPAVIDQSGHAIDYAELCARSQGLAQRLQHAGIRPDDRVAIWMDRSTDFIVSILGVLEAGAAYVPIDTSFPEERVSFIVENSGARVVITDLEEFEKANSTTELTTQLDPDNLAYVIYTSGSTGVPKGVAMSHRGLSRLIDWQLGDGPKGLTTLQFTPVCFDVTLQEVFSTLCAGGTLVLASEDWRRNPKLLLSELNEKKIERLFLPYVALQQLAKAAESGGARPQTLQHVITAGEQLIVTEAIAAFFRTPDCRLENQYGPTEAHLVTSFNLPADSAVWPKLPSIGAAVTDVTLYILDEKLDRVPAGAPGELYVGGDGLARCYVNAPDLTAERFLPNPFSTTEGARMYKTGDLVRVNEEGLLDFIGRADQQVKVRGFRVEPAEVELAITNHPHVEQAAVRLQTVADDVNVLVGYVVTGGNSLTALDLSEYLEKSLPDYMVPSRFVFLDSLPLTSTGKVDQQKLSEITLAPPVEDSPEISRVEMLRSIWERVLGHDEFELEDDFFEIGGDSLLATWVVTEIGNSVGREFDLSMLLEDSTIPGIARTLEELELRPIQARQPSQVVTLRPNSSKRLLFLVHPLGGEPVPYRALAHSIKSPVRVVGLCWRPTETCETTLEEMAAIHLAQMRAVQPEGPYLLAGWSFGGVLAYEIAQQIVASGATVEFLGLIDANPVRDSISGRLASDGSLLGKFTEALTEIDRKLAAGETDLSSLQADDYLYGLMGHSGEGVNANHLRQIMEVTKDSLAAVANYRPAPYTGSIDLFQPEDSTPEIQQLLHTELCALAEGPLRLHSIPGDHYSILRSPLVGKTAQAIDEALLSITRSSKSSTEALVVSV
ncbi:MAG TPA: amino acid adenylation domain-containing protein [Pyrinomonadaceae bacterium]|nr:amino acid adenylation domain-containing protein [Pyrinomonadaceae bacterium]